MLVKWEKRNLQNGANGNGKNLAVLLVELYQDNGSVKSRLIENLGAIEEKFLASKIRNMRQFHQGLFWSAVDKKLDRLGLDSQQRNRIEAIIRCL